MCQITVGVRNTHGHWFNCHTAVTVMSRILLCSLAALLNFGRTWNFSRSIRGVRTICVAPRCNSEATKRRVSRSILLASNLRPKFKICILVVCFCTTLDFALWLGLYLGVCDPTPFHLHRRRIFLRSGQCSGLIYAFLLQPIPTDGNVRALSFPRFFDHVIVPQRPLDQWWFVTTNFAIRKFAIRSSTRTYTRLFIGSLSLVISLFYAGIHQLWRLDALELSSA